ncbi:phospholipase D3-like isoform X2 [Photinus pyralis]|uniref:phospholipase D3-like isoform X2 n=1 Tax=Photinus pyralis TaxID=7054 RepID=UPI0012675C59|nr:phospholipase D3-like isoform X2 [Photinus pyralis]
MKPAAIDNCDLQKVQKTVLESPTSLGHEEDNDIWSQTYMLPGEDGNTALKRWGQKQAWCKPSCIPISIILVLIFLVVLLPLLDHAMERSDVQVTPVISDLFPDTCKLSLVESIPEGLTYPRNATSFPSTYHTWLELINSTRHTIEIASFYWTLRSSEVYPHPSSYQGEEVFQALLNTGLNRGIKIKIAQSAPNRNNPNIDTEYLVKRKAAEVRSVNFPQLLGSDGVLHTKLWIIDRTHFYIGSANMDWRSLTQVKEMGIVVHNCTSLAEDIGKIFDVYWILGEPGAKIPSYWPSYLETKYSINTPMNLTLDNDTFQTYISSSPPPLSPGGRTNDLEAIVNIIQKAEKFVYISVMDYFPLTIYSPKIKYWASLDNALRSAIIDKIEVRLLISKWNNTRRSEHYFLKSLADIADSYPKAKVEVRYFVVPATPSQAKIPFARVNHNKYMVTDNTAYIGTSNWSGDYFIDTAGIGFVVHDPIFNRNDSHITVRSQLQAVFERDWNSNYSYPISYFRF